MRRSSRERRHEHWGCCSSILSGQTGVGANDPGTAERSRRRVWASKGDIGPRDGATPSRYRPGWHPAAGWEPAKASGGTNAGQDSFLPHKQPLSSGCSARCGTATGRRRFWLIRSRTAIRRSWRCRTYRRRRRCSRVPHRRLGTSTKACRFADRVCRPNRHRCRRRVPAAPRD